jgi:UDP-3-O-[3-hydroxymyristoyl] glucosamine N-acyltransferase
MNMKTSDIAQLVSGRLIGDPDLVINGAAGLDEAGQSDISFVFNPKYVKHLSKSKAGVLLLSEEVAACKATQIIVKNPHLAFAQVLTIIEKEIRPSFAPGIHPKAVVAADVKIAKDVYIGPGVVIEPEATIGETSHIGANSYIGHGSRIGKNTHIYPNVTIRENVKVGNNVIIHPGAVLGSDGFGFVPSQAGHFKVPQIGSIEVCDDVEIGANVSIDRATTGKTKIGKGTKIDNLVQIAHNVKIGEHCFIVAQVGIAGSTVLGDFVTIAGQAGVSGHLKIGDGVTIAGQAAVIGDVPAREIVSGYPARPHREAMKVYALSQKLPELFDEVKDIKNMLLDIKNP